MSDQDYSALDHIQTLRWLITTKIDISNTDRVLLPLFKKVHTLSDDEILYMLVDRLGHMDFSKMNRTNVKVFSLTGYEIKRFAFACQGLTQLVTDSQDLDRKKLPVWFRCVNLSTSSEKALGLLFWCMSTIPDQKESHIMKKFSSLVNWGVATIVATQAISTFFICQYLIGGNMFL